MQMEEQKVRNSMLAREHALRANSIDKNYQARMQGKGPAQINVRSSLKDQVGPIKDCFEASRRGMVGFAANHSAMARRSEPARGRLNARRGL